MKRYWYLTKKTHEPRVFTQLPNGYDIFVGEVIVPMPNGTFDHVLLDRQSNVMVKRFNDKGLNFNGSRKVIVGVLNQMENQKRARKMHLKARSKNTKRIVKKNKK